MNGLMEMFPNLLPKKFLPVLCWFDLKEDLALQVQRPCSIRDYGEVKWRWKTHGPGSHRECYECAAWLLLLEDLEFLPMVILSDPVQDYLHSCSPKVSFLFKAIWITEKLSACWTRALMDGIWKLLMTAIFLEFDGTVRTTLSFFAIK